MPSSAPRSAWPPAAVAALLALGLAGAPRAAAQAGGAAPDADPAPASAPATAARDPLPPFLVVDLHGHAFNARHVPLRGILRGYGVPPVLARLTAWILLQFTDVDPDLDDAPAAGRPDRSRRRALRAALRGRTARARRREADPAASVEAVTAWVHERLEERGLSKSWMQSPRFAGDLERGPHRGFVRKVMQQAFARGAGPPGPGEVLGEEDLRHQLAFLVLLMRSEQVIAARHLETFPTTGLVVQHAVDLAPHYRGRPRLSLPRALTRMHNLTRAMKGRALRFVGYSPARADSLAHVRREVLVRGAAGVKVYPPSGYLPLGNRASEYDARNRGLFAFCQAEAVPVFSHSNDAGFEAKPGHGARYGVPERWLPVLRDFPALRLCFGHAGDYQGWTSPPPEGGADLAFLKSRAGLVYQLCNRYPNVYADFGHHEGVLVPEKAEALRRRLEWCIRRTPGFARKICYGSDFPMVARVAGYEGYLSAFWRLFAESPALAPHARGFFRQNALDYLDLPGYLDRRGPVLDPVAVRTLAHFAWPPPAP